MEKQCVVQSSCTDSENGMASQSRPKYALMVAQSAFYVRYELACFGLGASRCQLGRRTWGNLTLHKVGIVVQPPSISLPVVHALLFSNFE